MAKLLGKEITRGINERNHGEHTWKQTPKGMSWSYGVTFVFEAVEGEVLTVASGEGIRVTSVLFGSDKWCDCNTIEEAYYMATKKAIACANYIY